MTYTEIAETKANEIARLFRLHGAIPEVIAVIQGELCIAFELGARQGIKESSAILNEAIDRHMGTGK
jgi:pseudouridine-5'-phosphate glycosidase